MSDRSINEAINKMVGTHMADQLTYVNAIVEGVDIPTRSCSCTVIDGHTEYYLPTVKLMAVVDDGLFIEPAVGSTVKVIFSVKVEPFVCQYSEVENITIIAKTRITLNDGSFGGLVKINSLIDKINSLENDLNTLKLLIALWSPVPSDGGASLKLATAKWSAQSITPTILIDLENKNITHGQ